MRTVRGGKVRRTATAATIVLAATMAAAGAAGAAGGPRGGGGGNDLANRTTGFVVSCTVAHRAKDDPIVYPDQPGMSHAHDFYGSTAVNADATVSSMENAGTSCSTRGDTAGYWQPQLLVNGKAITGTARVYYTAGVADASSVQSFPEGLKMTAGALLPMPAMTMATKASAKTAKLPTDSSPYAKWGCLDADHDASWGSRPTQCAVGTQLGAQITFPSCWDGSSLDSANHRSHMAYPTGSACPASHPVAVPHVTLVVEWDARPAPSTLGLASGTTATLHADFWNTWDQGQLDHWVSQCINAGRVCRVLHD